MAQVTLELRSEAVRAGQRYRAALVEAEEKPGKNGTYMRMVFEIMEGPSEGRKVYTNRSWDLWKPLLTALGLIAATDSRKTWTGDSDTTLFKPVVIETGIIKGRDGYDDRIEPVAIYPDGTPLTGNLHSEAPPPEIPFSGNGSADPLFPDTGAVKAGALVGI